MSVQTGSSAEALACMQALSDGYGGSYPQGGPSHSMEQEQLSEGMARGGDMGRQAATPSELMAGGHEPQLHFDLDQMLDVHREAGLSRQASLEGRLLPRSGPLS